MNDEIFRAYDIRGVYPDDIDGELAKRVAKSLARFLKGKRIALSMDVRISNEALTKPFIEGLVESGVEVWFIGIAPTPVLYFTIAHYGLDGGAAISASHNPAQWNGFKLCGKGAKVLGWGEGLEKIKEIIKEDKFDKAQRSGNVLDKHDQVFMDYEKFVNRICKMNGSLKIGIDPGNGACCNFADGILSRAGHEIIAINNTPDGTFPARGPEPKIEKMGALRELVVKNKLDFGVAFDGDGDRAIFVDDKGEVVGGDQALALFVQGMAKKGDNIVYEVSCSDAVQEVIDKKGAVGIVSRVGHGPIESKMVEVDARMGGEISGHIYFREMYYFDDAFFAASKIVELIIQSNAKLSMLLSQLPQYKSKLVEIEVGDKIKFKTIDLIKDKLNDGKNKLLTIDGVKLITSDGWFIVRASNTGPNIKLVAEARTQKRLDELIGMGRGLIERASVQARK